LRDEYPNANWLGTLDDALCLIESWKTDDNEELPLPGSIPAEQCVAI
jgi:hypothetical protein